MVSSFKVYWSIFWRTFSVLAASAIAAAQTWDWAANGVKVNAETLGFALLMAAIGGLIAVGWAYVNTPAVTPLQKALRSAIQSVLGSALAGVVITNASDVLEAKDLVVPALVAVGLAFFLSYFNNQGGTPQPTDLTIPAKVYSPMDNVSPVE